MNTKYNLGFKIKNVYFFIFQLKLVFGITFAPAQDEFIATEAINSVHEKELKRLLSDFKSSKSGDRLEIGLALIDFVCDENSCLVNVCENELVNYFGEPDYISGRTIDKAYYYYCGRKINGIVVEFALLKLEEKFFLFPLQNSLRSCVDYKNFKNDIPDHLKLYYNDFVKKIKASEIYVNCKGVVKLPDYFPVISLNREVFVEQNEKGYLIVFRTWTGRNSFFPEYPYAGNFEGYLYAGNCMGFNKNKKNSRISVGPISFNIEEQLSENWYFVGSRQN